MTNLLELYIKLVGLVLLGLALGQKLPAQFMAFLGKSLFWVGGPISIIGFLYHADLSNQVWIAPAIAHLAIFLGAILAWIKIQGQAYLTDYLPQKITQGSLILTAMVGNTGYLGYPVTLALIGKEYFAWALFYDLLGSLLGAYGLGIALASYYGHSSTNTGEMLRQIVRSILISPGLWSFGVGLLFRQVQIPQLWSSILEILAWIAVTLSLVLIGMRLAKLRSWRHLPQAASSLAIKMLVVPLLIGNLLPLFGVTGAAAKVVILQMAMPPAFSTLLIAETFDLDRDLVVTALGLGVIVLLITIPLWLYCF